MPLDQKGYTFVSTRTRLDCLLTHISTFRGKFDVSRRFDQEFAFACHSHTSALRSEARWIIARSRLFPGLQTTEGTASVACLVRLRRGRRLVPGGTLQHHLTRRTVEHIDIKHLPRLYKSTGEGDILGGRRHISRGVIVGDDDRSSVGS